LIGDVSRDGVQYAVKGIFGSPQGVKDIIKAFKKIVEEDFSMTSFYRFIYKYTEEELSKKYKSQISKLSQETIDSTLQKIEKSLHKI
jgi:hypothetical protein